MADFHFQPAVIKLHSLDKTAKYLIETANIERLNLKEIESFLPYIIKV